MKSIAVLLSLVAICYSYPYGLPVATLPVSGSVGGSYSPLASPVPYGADVGVYSQALYGGYGQEYPHVPVSQQVLPDGSVISHPQGYYGSNVPYAYPWGHHVYSHLTHLGQTGYGGYSVPHLIAQIIQGEREILHQQSQLQQQQIHQQQQQEILQLQQAHQSHQLEQHQHALEQQFQHSPLLQHLYNVSPAYNTILQHLSGVYSQSPVTGGYGQPVVPFTQSYGGIPVPVTVAVAA